MAFFFATLVGGSRPLETPRGRGTALGASPRHRVRERRTGEWWLVARFVFRSVSGLATAIRGPPPPRVAHSTPLGLLYLGTHGFLRRAAGSVVAPGFVVSLRPSGAFSRAFARDSVGSRYRAGKPIGGRLPLVG